MNAELPPAVAEGEATDLLDLDLSAWDVWLSGAVPEEEHWQEPALDLAILEFVRDLASLIFSCGGRIVHGSHPSFTPVLMQQAVEAHERAARAGAIQPVKPLSLVVSQFYETAENHATWKDWESAAEVIRLPVGRMEGQANRQESLGILRDELADRCNAFVAVGGKWWLGKPGQAGVPQEFERALRRRIPCFIAAGFGGVATAYLKQNPGVLGRLENGLTEGENLALAQSKDVSSCAALIVGQLGELRASRIRSQDELPL